MSDITLEALKLRRRELQINVAMNQGALDEIDRIIAEMERRRGGRPRKMMQLGPDGVIRPVEMPQRVAGAAAEPETEESMT
jgi:hypothetical protein